MQHFKKNDKISVLIDFDGTCVTHDYPRVGKDIGSVKVLKRLVNNGHRLILFTMRSNGPSLGPINTGLADAINWFHENEIPLFAIQKDPMQHTWTSSPKAYGQLLIDDIGFGCPLIYDPKLSPRRFVDWVEVEKILEKMSLI